MALSWSWCFEVNTKRPPLPYNQFDVATLILWLFSGIWLLVLSLVALAKWHSHRFRGLNVACLMILNLGGFIQICAVIFSDGVLVGIPIFDAIRNFHCSLWDYWAEFAFGFNVWFCALAYLASTTCLTEMFDRSDFSVQSVRASAAAVVCFFSFLVLCLCVASEIGGFVKYDELLDICVTHWPLKLLMSIYAFSCLIFVIAISIALRKAQTHYSRMLITPFRTIAAIGLLSFVLLLVVNLTNITVYPAGRFFNALGVCLLILLANSIFYRDVLIDIFKNNSDAIVALGIELESLDNLHLDKTEQFRRDGFESSIIQLFERETRLVTLPRSILELTELTSICEVILREMKLSAKFTIVSIEDDDDIAPSERQPGLVYDATNFNPVDDEFELPVAQIAALANTLATTEDSKLNTREAFEKTLLVLLQTPGDPQRYIIPMPTMCYTVLLNAEASDDEYRFLRDCIVRITSFVLRAYKNKQ